MRSVHRMVVVLAALAVLSAACGDDDAAPMTLEDYVAEMDAVSTRFFVEAGPDEGPPSEGAYPLGGDLVAATELYTSYDDLLAAWNSLVPPRRVASLHADLVAALDRLQEKVGDYLMDEALEAGELEFETIGRKVNAEILAASQACLALRRAIGEAGHDDTAIFGDCEF